MEVCLLWPKGYFCNVTKSPSKLLSANFTISLTFLAHSLKLKEIIMAALRNLLSRAHRHQCLARTAQTYLSPLLHHHQCRHFSSSTPLEGAEPSSTAPTQPQPDSKPRNPVPLVPVSYSVKKSDQENPSAENEFPPQDRRQQQQQLATSPNDRNDVRTWTREDFRFVKDTPSIAPVSYPTRVAPLPEDRVVTKEVGDEHGSEELERERSRIEAGNLNISRMLVVEEEKVPFPTLIRLENSKGNVVYDLKEAIQLVKVSSFLLFVSWRFFLLVINAVCWLCIWIWNCQTVCIFHFFIVSLKLVRRLHLCYLVVSTNYVMISGYFLWAYGLLKSHDYGSVAFLIYIYIYWIYMQISTLLF